VPGHGTLDPDGWQDALECASLLALSAPYPTLFCLKKRVANLSTIYSNEGFK
jgi:hypothetical protein